MAINYPQTLSSGAVVNIVNFGHLTVAKTATIAQDQASSSSNSSTVSTTDTVTNIPGSSLFSGGSWTGTGATQTWTVTGGSGVAAGVKFTNGIELVNTDYLWNTATLISGTGS